MIEILSAGCEPSAGSESAPFRIVVPQARRTASISAQAEAEGAIGNRSTPGLASCREVFAMKIVRAWVSHRLVSSDRGSWVCRQAFTIEGDEPYRSYRSWSSRMAGPVLFVAIALPWCLISARSPSSPPDGSVPAQGCPKSVAAPAVAGGQVYQPRRPLIPAGSTNASPGEARCFAENPRNWRSAPAKPIRTSIAPPRKPIRATWDPACKGHALEFRWETTRPTSFSRRHEVGRIERRAG